MKKLCLNLVHLFVGVVITSLLIIILTPRDQRMYLAAVQDKIDYLAKTPSPRIILVGGSNIAFSINSSRISKQFNMPVINMGLHAGLGLSFMANQVIPYIEKGDVVIFIPEYEHFDNMKPLTKELGYVIKMCPQCLYGISYDDIFPVIMGLFQTQEMDMIRAVTGKIEVNFFPYGRQYFNGYGDLILNNSDSKIKFTLPIKTTPFYPSDATSILNSASAKIRARGGKSFLMYPGIPSTLYGPQKKILNTLHKNLSDALNIPIIGTPKIFVFKDTDFFNTEYHMNSIGRERRTDVIIEQLLLINFVFIR